MMVVGGVKCVSSDHIDVGGRSECGCGISGRRRL